MSAQAKKIVLFCISFFGTFLMASSVFAKYGLEETAGYAGLKSYGSSIPDLIGRVIGAGLSMVSVVFFALMIYAGIAYMLSRGNEEAAKKALNMIWAAIIGILIVLASYALTSFVFKAIGGEPVAAPAATTSEDNSAGDQALTDCKPKAGKTVADFCSALQAIGLSCEDSSACNNDCSAADGQTIAALCGAADQEICSDTDLAFGTVCEWPSSN